MVRYSAVLLLLLTAGCASLNPDPPVSQPEVVATPPEASQPAASQPAAAQPAEPQPAAKPVADTAKPIAPAPPQQAAAALPAPPATTPAPKPASKDAPPVAKTPAPTARTPAPGARPPAPSAQAPKPAAPPVAAPPAPQTLDLDALEAQLKATKAIGVFTKISLKNQVDDLMKQFSDYYQGKGKLTLTELRRSYDLLMMKVLSLLQDDDQKLAAAVFSSREAIWGLLSDQKKFAALQS